MGHLSLYRKHRPQTFADVVGQEHVTRTLGKAVAEGRLAHAYLFSGPRGTGKTSTARILAKCLNCEQGPTAEPCNVCTSCVEITAGRSLDVVEIDAASHGSVDDARDIREKVAYSPAAGRSRVYIVDECHMLSPAANNALLKVLEEPPAHVVFVFATTEPHKVLQTLLDRCQRYEMRAISADDVAGRVRHVAALEGIDIDPEAVAILGQRAGGSMRDALSLLDQLASYADGSITAEDLAKLLGSVPGDMLTEAIDIVSAHDAGAAFLYVDRVVRDGRDIRELVRAFTQHLRSLFLVLHAPAAQEILDVSDIELERLRSHATRFDANELLRLIDLANETSLALRQAVEGRLVLEVMLVRMARADLHPSPAAVLSRIERLERLAGVQAGTAEAPGAGQAAGRPGPVPAAPAAGGGRRPAAPTANARSEWRKEIGAAPRPPAGEDAGTRARNGPGPQPAAPDAASADAGVDPWAGMEASPARPAPAAGPVAPGSATPRKPAPASAGPVPTPAPAPAAPAPAAAGPSPTRPTPAAPASGTPPPAPAAAPRLASPAAAGPDIDLDRIRTSWEGLLEKVKKRRISARAMLLPALPVAWRGGELVLEFDDKSRFHRDQMSDVSYQAPLVEAFAETFGVRPRIRCVLREPGGSPARPAADGTGGTAGTVGAAAPAEAEEDEIADEGDTTPVQSPTGHVSAVDLIREGFGAEIVEEF